MSLLCFSGNPPIAPKVTQSWRTLQCFPSIGTAQRTVFALKCMNTEFFGRTVVDMGSKLVVQWSFVGGSKLAIHSEVARIISLRKCCSPSASWITSPQIASNAFTWGTVAVLPFYSLMVLAPNAALTKKAMESSVPYVVLGVLYAYLLYLSWTPETLRSMFASKYWLPELPGIAKMFSNEITVSSAWIHLLAVDLFAARQVFHDGLTNKIETRHSVSLCLLFCPVGILAHVITKVLTETATRSN